MFAWPKSSSSVDVLFGLVEFVVDPVVSVSIPPLPCGDDKDLSQILYEGIDRFRVWDVSVYEGEG